MSQNKPGFDHFISFVTLAGEIWHWTEYFQICPVLYLAFKRQEACEMYKSGNIYCRRLIASQLFYHWAPHLRKKVNPERSYQLNP